MSIEFLRRRAVLSFVTVLVGGAGVGLEGAADDARWDRRFGMPFLNGAVQAMAAAGDDLYVGGAFTQAGAAVPGQGTVVNHVFRWRDGEVTALGAGLNGAVHAVAAGDGEVYVGGAFTQAGGVEASRVARWDGQSWSPLGSGANGVVHALLVHEGSLYMGGQFSVAGGVTVNGVARWNGTEWSALGEGVGVGGAVRALGIWNGRLYAGGQFFLLRIINGVPELITNLACWDGESWSAVGGGVNGPVQVLRAQGAGLLAGGTFTTAGGVTVNKLARWDGTAWSALGGGFSTGVIDGVNALAVFEDQLVAGGYFTAAGGEPVNAVARWDGAAWKGLGEGVVSVIGGVMTNRATISALASVGGQLHVGGNFNRAGAREAASAATWVGGDWRAFGLGLGGLAYAVHRLGEDVVVGGIFPTAGGLTVNSVARWTGSDWAALGDGVRQDALPGQVHALASRGTDVYAAGVFNRAGAAGAVNVARWNGSEWSPLGTGLGGNAAVVRALALTADGTLYAGGFFNTSQGVRGMARWDGASWSGLGSGISAAGGFGEVRALVAVGNDLYVGGAFNNAGGVATVGIARWDGTAWSAVGGGMNATVLALASDGAGLYAGGYFTVAGGQAARRVARWDGTAWSALGEGLGAGENDFVHALAVDGGRVYAGGVFTALGDGTAASHVAGWDGSGWSALGSGTGQGSPPAVYGLAVGAERLYVGGTFGQAGGIASSGVAIWDRSGGEPGPVRLLLAWEPDGRRVLRFVGAAGQGYRVWSTPDLGQAFVAVSEVITGTGGEVVYEDATPAGGAGYYQVRTSEASVQGSR